MTAQDRRNATRERPRPAADERVGTRERPIDPSARSWPADQDLTTASAARRDRIATLNGLAALAGLWLIVSPWAVGDDAAAAWWNPITCGAIVTTVATVRVAIPNRTPVLGWVTAAIGAWLLASGFWLVDSTGASWNVWIVGTIVFALTLAGVAVDVRGPSRPSHGSCGG